MTTADGAILSTTKIVDNGPPTVLWNLVILGDGYQATQMAQYATDVQGFVDTMFQTPPFDELRRAINVYRVDVTSTDSGADDPLTMSCAGSGTTARTYFDATYCGDGRAQRLLYVNNTTVLDTVRAQVPEWDVPLVVVNSAIYGGAARDGVAAFSLAPGADQIALHEIGHAAFGLADEYEYFLGCGSGETDRNNHPAADPAQVNVTTNTDRATLKWRRFVASATPVPTTENANCAICDPLATSPVTAGTVGLFEGANTYHCDAYRPEFTCKMRVLTDPFCAVCRHKIRTDLAVHLPEAVEGLEEKVVLGDSSDRGPALASHGNRLFLAWKGSGNEQLNLMFSEDGGATFRGKRVFGDSSDRGPALVSHGGRLFLAWTGEGNGNLNVAKVRLFADTSGGLGIEGLEEKVVLGDSSDRGPALASHGNRLFLAWKGSGNEQLNLMFSEDGGATFRGKRVFGDSSDRGPALVSHGGRLFLAWTGEGDENLSVAHVRPSTDAAGSFAIEGLDEKFVAEDSSGAEPALVRHCGRAFLAWKGSSNEQLNLAFFEDNGATFRGKRVFGDSSDHGPALASHGNRLLLAWTGEGEENLNVAKVRLTLLANILWPQRVITSVFDAANPLENPQGALGKPDGTVYVLDPGTVSGEEKGATFGEFGGGFYQKLAQLLGASPPVTHGDTVSPENLARADVVAFERNGAAPATGGGWEDCRFTFADGLTSLSVSWNGTLGAPRDPHVVANGSVRGSDYKSYFGLPSGAVPDGEVISFLLFTLPELDTEAPNFTVAVRGQPSGNVVRTLDDFTTGSASFCVPPETTETRFQRDSMLGGVRCTNLHNRISPPGKEVCLNVGSADRLNLMQDPEQYTRLEVIYGLREDGVHPLELDLHEGNARSIRATISPLAGASTPINVINFNVEMFTPVGWSILGHNTGAGQIDFPFDQFSGPGGQDFSNVSYMFLIFQTSSSFKLESIETVTGGVPNEPNIDAIGLVRCAGV